MGAPSGSEQNGGNVNMKDKMTIEARRYYVVVKDNTSRKFNNDTIILSKQQLQAAETLGQVFQEIIIRVYRRQKCEVLAIDVGEKKKLVVDLDVLWRETVNRPSWFDVKDKIVVEARRFPVVVKDKTGVISNDSIVLSKQQLQAAEIVGQSSKEIIVREYQRQRREVLDIGKAEKKSLAVDLDVLWRETDGKE